MTEIQNTNNIPELHSPFEQLREVDADDKEQWNSRKLAKVMGYGKYWNFERVIAKAQAQTSQKGYHIGEHFVEITEMAELGSAAVREVTSIRLSRAFFLTLAFLYKKTPLLVEKFDCHLVQFFLRDSLAYRDEQAWVEYRLVGEFMQSTKVLHVGTLGKATLI